MINWRLGDRIRRKSGHYTETGTVTRIVYDINTGWMALGVVRDDDPDYVRMWPVSDDRYCRYVRLVRKVRNASA